MELTSVLPSVLGISLMGPETLCSSPPSRGSSAARLAIDTIYGQNVSPLFPEGLIFAPIPLYPPKSNRLHRKPPPPVPTKPLCERKRRCACVALLGSIPGTALRSNVEVRGRLTGG